jgi:outer membrane protein TolC
VPGNVAAMLEVRLGENGHDAIGFAAHVPHYLAQATFPEATLSLTRSLNQATGLAVPLDALESASATTMADIAEEMAGSTEVQELVASLERRVAALRRAVDLARLRYDNGYSDYLEVLDTERSLFSAELALTSARGDGYRALVDLYRALGGDWIGRIAPLPVAGNADDGRDATRPTQSPTSPY